jgi:hypothetical protein
VKGVHLVYGRIWRGCVIAGGKRYAKNFGTNKEAATEWVKAMREKLHGEFARHE